MNNLIVSNTALGLTGVFVGLALWIGYREKLGIAKDLIIATFCCVIQLFVVGYVLKYVFRVDSWLLTLLLILVIIFNGAYNAKGRSNDLKKFLSDFSVSNCDEHLSNFTSAGLCWSRKIHSIANYSVNRHDCQQFHGCNGVVLPHDELDVHRSAFSDFGDVSTRCQSDDS